MKNLVLTNSFQKFGVKDFNIFDDDIQVAYEFYDDWLKSGGIELELGANRLTSRQLFWIAVTKVRFEKKQSSEGWTVDKGLHRNFYSKPGFKSAYYC